MKRATGPILAALRKAEEHGVAADAVAAIGNYPMATSHVVLGLEELAVIKIHKGDLLGFYQFGEGPNAIDLSKALDRELFEHDTKLLAIVLYAAMRRVVRVRTTEFIEARNRGTTVDEAELVRREGVAAEEAKRLMADLGRLKSMKEGGLYSGDLDRRGDPTVRATKADFDLWRPVLADCIEVERNFLGSVNDELDDAMVRIANKLKEAIEPTVRKTVASREAKRPGQRLPRGAKS